MVSLRFCGPKFSICCTLISIWGFIMLPIMGVLLSNRSLAFSEDLVEDLEYNSTEDFIHKAEERYATAAKTCYIAGAIYLGSFALSAWQFVLNQRRNGSNQYKNK
ncbi:Ribonuclease kappa-B [Sarcoptes scabiei]|nr:Ribonuclease kappa-B [Sarcoptes scabiei]